MNERMSSLESVGILPRNGRACSFSLDLPSGPCNIVCKSTSQDPLKKEARPASNQSFQGPLPFRSCGATWTSFAAHVCLLASLP